MPPLATARWSSARLEAGRGGRAQGASQIQYVVTTVYSTQLQLYCNYLINGFTKSAHSTHPGGPAPSVITAVGYRLYPVHILIQQVYTATQYSVQTLSVQL